MQAYGRSSFADLFAAKAADTSYSDHPTLRGLSQYDIRAAGEALWAFGMREDIDVSGLDEEIITTALLAREDHWDDEGELVSMEFQEYWDQTDRQRFPARLLREMQEHMTHKYLSEKRAEGYITVSNRDGIWLFRKDKIWSGDTVKV